MSTLNNNTMNTNNTTTTASTPRKSFRFEPYQMNYSRVWLGSSPTMTSASNTAATNAHQANMSLSGASDDPMLSSSSLEESGALHALSITTPLHVCAAAPAPTGTESMSASSSIESEDADQQENDEDDANNNYASDSDENENHHREDGEMPSAGAAADATVNDDDEEIEKPTKAAEAQRAPTRTMQHLLQTVPYLFLDTVALATAQSQDRARTHQTRVGDSVSAWSGSNASTLGSISGGGDIKDIFVAQLPFDMPLSALQELADLLITEEPRIQIVHAAPHYRKGRAYDGCAFLKMSEGDAHRFIDALHKRVLFDVDGVWVASTPQEIRELTDYCAWMQELRPDQRRQILHIPTPFSALTAEFALRATRGVTTTTNNNQPPFQHHAGMMMPHHHQHHQLHHGVSQASSVMSTPPLGPAPVSSADHTVADAPMLGGMMMPPAQPMFFASHASSSSSSSSYHQHPQHMMHQQPQRNMPYYAQHHSAQHAQHVMPISTAAATAAAFCDAVPMQPLHYNGPSSAQYYNQQQHQQQQQQYPGYANNYYNGYSAQRSHHGTF